jgi:regulator of replication initiation timing
VPDVPEDRIRALEMENELLSLELESLRAVLESGRPQLEHEVDDARIRELLRAEKDLKRLLRRLGKGPAGQVVRRTPGYRNLAARYLEGEESG